MSFLNATLLAGVLAAAVPVVLHLLARQQPKRVVFPGVAFLTSRLTQQNSRLKIRRWWLLALRVLAVVGLALVLARPHIDSAMASTWTTIGLVAAAAMGLVAMASVALTRNMSRGLVWSLFIASLVAGIGSVIGAVATLANSNSPVLNREQPLALAIVIDNSPSSAWMVASDEPGTDRYFDRAIEQARSLVKRLPAGSRLGVIDRSPTPVGFSLDSVAAQTRLGQFKPLAVPVPIVDRIEAAIELVQTSDLPNRQVIVVTDLSAPTWDQDSRADKTSANNARLNADRRGEVQVSVLNVRGDDRLNTFNRSLSLPEFAESAPAAGTAIPIRIAVSSSSGSSDQASETTSGSTATIQLQLYENDRSLPLVRDGKTVVPPLRTVDRASVTLSASGTNEVVLSLPPLPLGTYHAVVELVGDDQFAWDNRRYLTIDLPKPPKVLVIGDVASEVNVIAAAMTAPNEITDPAAAYAIETVSYRDLSAIDWQPFELMMMIDPPIRYSTAQQRWIGSPEGLSSTMLDQLTEMVTAGNGLLLSLGPSTEVIGDDNTTNNGRASENSIGQLTPKLKRLWRVPDPGTFLQLKDRSHPILATLTQPATKPNWSDFRIRRYWQSTASDWNVIATMAQRREPQSANAIQPPAIMTRSLGEGRIAVTTTPLPAIGPVSRSWNDLFTSGDAWPAFLTVRGIASWLAGLETTRTTILAGQTVVLDGFEPSVQTDNDTDEPESENLTSSAGRIQVYPPTEAPYQVSLQSSGDQTATLTLTNPSEPGTYFFRSLNEATSDLKNAGNKGLTGVSANLPEVWSDNRAVDAKVLATWFGGEPSGEAGSGDTWSIDTDPETLTLGGGTSAGSAVSLHGPLMLFALMMFLGEQLLSNYFYARDHRLKPETT